MPRPSSLPSSLTRLPLQGTRSIALLATAALLSTACGNSGGGGDSGGGSGPGTPAGTGGTLQFFQASLHAVDPLAPGTVIDVDPAAAEIATDRNGAGALPAIAGSFAGGTLSDARVASLLYPRDDGTLWRVATDPGATPPTPVRVSSERMALPYCEGRIGVDVNDPTNTRLAYGSDGVDCSGALTWRVVTFSDDELTDPRDFPGEPIEALVDPATGAHAGWLALDSGSVHRLAPDLTVAAADLLESVEQAAVLGATADGTLFLEVDQALYAYAPTTDAVQDLGFEFGTPCPCDGFFASGGDVGFAIDEGQLLRVDPAAGSASAIDSPSDAVTGFFAVPGFVAVGAGRVAWSYTADDDGNPQTLDLSVAVRSVDRDGGNPLELRRRDLNSLAPPTFSGFIVANSAEWVFFNEIQIGNRVPAAIGLELSGAGAREDTSAFWVGTTIAPALDVARRAPLTRMLLLRGLDDLTDLSRNTSLSLESVSASDPLSAAVSLGALPADGQFAFALPGLGPARLGVLLAPDGMNELRTDVLFWDDTVAGSLRRVTETDGIDEFPAPLF